MPVLMILSIIIYLSVIVFALIDYKKTIIIWTPLSLLFNSQVCIIYHPKAMSLTLAVNLTLLGLYLFQSNINNKYNKEDFPLKGFMFLMLISYMISSFFSIIPFGASINNIVKLVIQSYGIVYVFFKCIKTEKDIQLFVRMALYVSILIIIDGLIENFTHINIAGDFIYETSPHDSSLEGRSFYVPYYVSSSFCSRYGLTRCFSFFSIHIAFGVACVFLFYLMRSFLKYKWIVFPGMAIDKNMTIITICAYLLVIGVLLSNSKTSLLGICVILFSFYNIKHFLSLKIILLIIVSFFIVTSYFPNYFDNLTSLFDEDVASEGGGSTVSMRELQMKYILILFEMSPIVGNGINAAFYYSQHVSGFSDILGAESVWFRLLAEQGLIGCFVYAYGYFAMHRMCYGIIPCTIYIPYLIAILIMDSVTGNLNYILYMTILIVVRKQMQLSR